MSELPKKGIDQSLDPIPHPSVILPEPWEDHVSELEEEYLAAQEKHFAHWPGENDPPTHP